MLLLGGDAPLLFSGGTCVFELDILYTIFSFVKAFIIECATNIFFWLILTKLWCSPRFLRSCNTVNKSEFYHRKLGDDLYDRSTSSINRTEWYVRLNHFEEFTVPLPFIVDFEYLKRSALTFLERRHSITTLHPSREAAFVFRKLEIQNA